MLESRVSISVLTYVMAYHSGVYIRWTIWSSLCHRYLWCVSYCIYCKKWLNLLSFSGYKCGGELCEGRPAAPLTGSTPSMHTPRTGASDPTITDHHVMVLDAFLLHHSYTRGYTPSSWDFTLHQALLKQYPQLCVPLVAQSKCENEGITHYNDSPSQLHHIFPHLTRWAIHLASITEEEKLVLPRSDQTIEEILHHLMEQIEARVSD